MNRWGYIAIAVLVLGATLWLLRPADGPVRIVTASRPQTFTVALPGSIQQVDGRSVSLGTLVRPLDRDAVRNLWSTLGSLRSRRSRSASPADADAFGLNRRIEAEGLLYRWGVADGGGWLWDGRAQVLHVVDATQLAALDAQAARLDARRLISEPPGDQLVLDGVRLQRLDGAWRAPDQPQRPPLTMRVGQLIEVLQGLQLDRVQESPDSGLPERALLVFEGSPSRRIDLSWSSTAARVAVSGLPAQDYGAQTAQALAAAVAACHGNAVVELDLVLNRESVDRITVTHGTATPMMLVRRATRMGNDSAAWDVVWPQGRDRAAPGAAMAVLDLLAARAVVPKLVPMPPPIGDGVRIAIDHDLPLRRLELGLAHGLIMCGGFAGPVADAEGLVAALSGERWVDRRPLRVTTERVVKAQVRRRSGEHETARRGADGAWSRTFPAVSERSFDGVAVERLLRILAQPASGPARPATPGTATVAAIDLRIAPSEPERLALDDADLEESIPVDVGIDLVLEGGSYWLADRDAGTWRPIDEDGASALLRPWEAAGWVPIVPALVLGIEVDGGVSLWRDGSAWMLRDGAGVRGADALAVRRWLRSIAALHGPPLDPRAVITPADLAATVRLRLLAADGGEEIASLRLGRPGADGVRLMVGSDRADSRLPRGVGILPSSLFNDLVPTATMLEQR